MLVALSEQGNAWSHGDDLCGRLGLKAGTVYPIVLRLADLGQAETTREQDTPRGRPPRHLYRLSRAGAELVGDLQAEPVADRRMAGPPRRATGTAGA